MNMSISLYQNNFINELQKLFIKTNNYSYCYNFLFIIDSSDSYMKINLDLNGNDLYHYRVEIEEYFHQKNENNDNSGTFYV